MPTAVTILGGLSILLTLVGSYRFTGYFFGGNSAYAALIAISVTFVYVMFFEVILLVIGMASIAIPAVALYQRSATGGSLPTVPVLKQPSGNIRKSSQVPQRGQLDAYADQRCPNCGDLYQKDSSFCGQCGENLSMGDGS